MIYFTDLANGYMDEERSADEVEFYLECALRGECNVSIYKMTDEFGDETNDIRVEVTR